VTSPESPLQKALAVAPALAKLGYRLLRDPRVPVKNRAFVGLALGYAVSPIDVVPDFIPILGRVDDILLLALALDHLFDAAGEGLVKEHWDGPVDALEIVGGVLDWGAGMVPWPVRRFVKRALGSF
jgi:uncharacterized membrane protein YkvA (DUF1232 family)